MYLTNMFWGFCNLSPKGGGEIYVKGPKGGGQWKRSRPTNIDRSTSCYTPKSKLITVK